jgi:hypothetical protein
LLSAWEEFCLALLHARKLQEYLEGGTMRKLNISMMLSLAIALLAGLIPGQVHPASAQGESPVGVVVSYIPGQSITVADQTGAQHEYMIASNVKILPPGRASSLAVGSFVTIIAPASLSQGKQTAVGIVVHPAVPGGWVVPTMSSTPVATETGVGTETATPIGTSVTDTATPVGTLVTETATPVGTLATDTATPTETTSATPLATDTATETPTPSMLETPTETPTPSTGGVTISTNTLIDWLASLFRELLTSQ